MEDLYRFCGQEAGEFTFVITREDTFANTGTPEEPCFVPLELLGEEY
jgi:hypothetical protein